MSLRKAQAGFSAVELIIVLVVLGLIGFAGYTVYNRQQANPAATTEGTAASQQAKDKEVPAAPEIKSTEDLDKAITTLDKMDTEGDGAELDGQLNDF